MSSAILIITTGGTIGAMPYADVRHPPVYVEMPPAGKDYVREAVELRFPPETCRVASLEPRDSKLFDDAYRDHLIRLVDAAPEDAVLITHGTDTLLMTADYLHRKASCDRLLERKKIILTGAMIPLANGPQSDGYRNLIFSMERLAGGAIEPGVYIVLCDYVNAERHEGWSPRLYRFAPGRYRKYHDPHDATRSRLVTADEIRA